MQVAQQYIYHIPAGCECERYFAVGAARVAVFFYALSSHISAHHCDDVVAKLFGHMQLKFYVLVYIVFGSLASGLDYAHVIIEQP